MLFPCFSELCLGCPSNECLFPSMSIKTWFLSVTTYMTFAQDYQWIVLMSNIFCWFLRDPVWVLGLQYFLFYSNLCMLMFWKKWVTLSWPWGKLCSLKYATFSHIWSHIITFLNIQKHTDAFSFGKSICLVIWTWFLVILADLNIILSAHLSFVC